MLVVSKILIHSQASKRIEILVQHLAHLIRVMHNCSDEIPKYSVRWYDHEIFVHAGDEPNDKSPLIKHACWVTEHMNGA